MKRICKMYMENGKLYADNGIEIYKWDGKDWRLYSTKQKGTRTWICWNCWINCDDVCKIIAPNNLIPQHCPFMTKWKATWREEKER